MEFFPSPIPLQALIVRDGQSPSEKKYIYKLTVHIEFNHDTTQTRYLAIFFFFCSSNPSTVYVFFITYGLQVT